MIRMRVLGMASVFSPAPLCTGRTPAAARHRGLLPRPHGHESADRARREVRAVQCHDTGRERQQHEDRVVRGAGGRLGAAVEGPSGRGRTGGRGGGRGAVATGVTSPDGKWLRRRRKSRSRRRPEVRQRLREAPPGALQGRDVRLEGLPARRRGVPCAESRRGARAADAAAAGAGDGEREDDRRHRSAAVEPGVAPGRPADRVHRRRDWRDELKYDRPDCGPSTIDGKVTRLTNDGSVYSDVGFSPDGKYPLLRALVRHRHDHPAEAESWRPARSYIRQVDGGGSRSTSPPRGTSNRPARSGRPTAGSSTSPRRSAARATCSASPPARHGPKVEQVTKGPRRLGNLTIDKAFTRIAYTVGLHDAPAELYAADIDGTDERRLTERNTAICDELALSKGERLQWKSDDGTPIEGWLLPPANYDAARGPYPLIVVSHGGPHAATGYSFDFKKQFFAANGYFVLDTNFRSSTGYGDAFKWATWGEWGKKDGEDVVAGIDVVIKKVPDRPEARRPHRPLLRRVHDQLADHPVSRSLRRRDHRRGHLATGSATTARPTSTARRKRSSSARRGRRNRAIG